MDPGCVASPGFFAGFGGYAAKTTVAAATRPYPPPRETDVARAPEREFLGLDTHAFLGYSTSVDYSTIKQAVQAQRR